jgi:hypothetical protein
VADRRSCPIQFDHLFICTSLGAPGAERLVTFGLSEGEPNVHPGQGTACRRFFFRNSYLELLWVNDPNEAQSDLVRPTHLWERWSGRDTGACPFGLCFRPVQEHIAGPSFSTWDYRPPYLPDSLSLAVGTNAAVLTEPFLCYLPFVRRPDSAAPLRRQPLGHPAGLRELTRVTLSAPWPKQPSEALPILMGGEIVGWRKSKAPLAELGFDGELSGKTQDFRPALPLIFHW